MCVSEGAKSVSTATATDDLVTVWGSSVTSGDGKADFKASADTYTEEVSLSSWYCSAVCIVHAIFGYFVELKTPISFLVCNEMSKLDIVV